MTARRHALTAAVFTALAVAHTWPLASAPGRLWRAEHGDYQLNVWTIAWVAHQAVRDPVHLFDANIFHPEPRTLAFSEHMAPQAALAAPVLWAGGSPILAFNLVTIAGLALTGWAMAALVSRWTGDLLAGLVAGSAAAFNAHTLTRLAHLQTLHLQYLPLALLALDELLRRPAARLAVRLAIFSALQALTSGYLLVFTTVGLGAAAAARTRDWRERGWAGVGAAALSSVVFAALVLPFLVPYYRVRTEQGLVRTLDEVGSFSASWVDYVTTASRFYMATPLRWAFLEGGGVDALFPGVAVAALALAALVMGAWRDARARMFIAIGAAGLWCSAGVRAPGYSWLYDHLPVLQGIRAPSRFGLLFLLAVAALAGYGVASMRRRWIAAGRRPLATALSALALIAIHGEALRAPLGYDEFRGFSPVYSALARLDDAVVAEFPLYPPETFQRNAYYMVASTAHWRPLVNGYSGYKPMSYRRLVDDVRGFPDARAVEALRGRGVTHVVVHRERYGEGRDALLRRMEASGAFEPAVGDEFVRVYAIRGTAKEQGSEEPGARSEEARGR